MTVKGASQTMCELDGLTFAQLKDIATGLARPAETLTETPTAHPTVCVDCNNAWYKGGGTVGGVVAVLVNFAEAGWANRSRRSESPVARRHA